MTLMGHENTMLSEIRQTQGSKYCKILQKAKSSPLSSVIQSISRVRLFATPGSHARLPCPSPSPGVGSNSCPLTHWCHPTISLSVTHYSSCPQFFPASGFFPGIWLFRVESQKMNSGKQREEWWFPGVGRSSLVNQSVKTLSAMWETQVQSLGQEDPLEKEMATHSSILAWRIPWTGEPGRLESTGSPRVRHD